MKSEREQLADWLESPQCGLMADERVQRAATLLRAARPEVDAPQPQESPLAWLVFTPNHPEGFDYLVFPDEYGADCEVGSDPEGEVREVVPLYRASAFSPRGTLVGCQHNWIYVANVTGQPYWQCDKCLEATNTDPLPSLLPQSLPQEKP